MDYSGLVEAIQNGDNQKVNALFGEAAPILKKYLISNIDASPQDAEDAVQKMFEYLIPKIRKDEIRNPAGLLSYMLKGARHSYLKNIRDFDLELFDEIENEPFAGPEQIWNLIDEERESLLKKCLEKMKKSYREMIRFLFEHPEADSEDIAEHFDISINNAWIRKHRIIKKLSDCVNSFS